MKIPPPVEEVFPLNRAWDLLILGWLGILAESEDSSARNLAVAPNLLAPPLNSPDDCEAPSVGWSDPNNEDFPNNMLGGGLENWEGTAGWTGGSSVSSKTGVLGLVPADLATLDWAEPNNPEPPWKSPLLLPPVVSVEERGFPNRALAPGPGSAGGFPNNGAAEPNIPEPEAPGSTLLLLGPNNPEEKQ